jgi:hypothetical protein
MIQAIRLQLRRLAEVKESAQKRRPEKSTNLMLEDLHRWHADLRPMDLVGRVQDLTSLDYWEAMKGLHQHGNPQKSSPYEQLAQEVLSQHEVVQQLVDWFDSDRVRSAFNLGIALGEADRGGVIAPTMSSWLEAGRCRGVVAGYLRGIASRQAGLSAEWGQGIDRAAEGNAEYAALVTIDADFSRSGYRRIMHLVGSGMLTPACLSAFTSPNWEALLGVEEKVEILQLIVHLQERDRQQALSTALSLGITWTHYGSVALPQELAGLVLQILRASLDVRVDPHAWSSLLQSLAPTHPDETADLVTNALTSAGPLRMVLEDLTLEILLDLAGQHPRLVMEAVGRRLLDPDRAPFFGLLRFQGLFEAIGLQQVQRWVTEHGAEPIRYIARHLESPRLQNGEPFIPPVTEWMLTHFGGSNRVFEEFCMGRHAFEVREGHARERRAELERAVTPFLEHRLPWVRRWAEYELKENEREAKIDDYLDDRQERM